MLAEGQSRLPTTQRSKTKKLKIIEWDKQKVWAVLQSWPTDQIINWTETARFKLWSNTLRICN